MITLFLAAVVFTANQGTLLQITFPHEPGMKAVEVQWQTKTVPAVRVNDSWMTVLGIDLDTRDGEHKAAVTVTFEGGRVDKRETLINVVEKKYPTTELKVAEQFVQLSKANLDRANREAKETDAIFNTITNEALWTEPFTSPIPGRTGTNFGHRRVFNGEPRAPHGGADLRATTGTPIHATNRGRVVLAKNLFFTGNTVILDHGLGIYTLYAHLSRIDVKRDTIVKNGQIVGLAGATGRVTGPHLHWGTRAQGARVDPFTLPGIGK
jgi:murein DD-endopeptidase MepM/ murein hydrolase activator NlpD